MECNPTKKPLISLKIYKTVCYTVIQCVLSQVDASVCTQTHIVICVCILEELDAGQIKALTVTDFTASGKVIQKCGAETKICPN